MDRVAGLRSNEKAATGRPGTRGGGSILVVRLCVGLLPRGDEPVPGRAGAAVVEGESGRVHRVQAVGLVSGAGGDGVGWHKAKDLVVPTNMTLLFLPPYPPELMPMERVWAWMRQHDLSNRVFIDAAEID